jgi:predicted metal-dependent enzyme (double-stranded beta helix superfamily)
MLIGHAGATNSERGSELQELIWRIQRAVPQGPEAVASVMREKLRSGKNWLDPRYQALGRREVAMFPLHSALTRSFSIATVVIRPDVRLPVHNHNGWAVLAVYSGRVREIRYRRLDDGRMPDIARVVPERTLIHDRGTACVLPDGHIHTALAIGDEPAVTIQVYGTTLDNQGGSTFDVHSGHVGRYRPHYCDPSKRALPPGIPNAITSSLQRKARRLRRT